MNDADRLRPAAPRGLRVRLHHGDARHVRDRHHHSGAAEAGRELHGRRHGEGRRGLRRVRHRVGADAVPLLAPARRNVRSLRAAADHPAVELRPRIRLHPDGTGANGRLAVPRAHHLGHHGCEHQHGGRLHRGRHTAGTAGVEVRHAGRGVRRRLRRRSGARRRSWSHRSAPAFLGRSGSQPGECDVRVVRAARIVAARAAQCLHVAQGESGRRTAPAALTSRAVGPRMDDASSAISRMPRCRASRCFTWVIATAGTPSRPGCC